MAESVLPVGASRVGKKKRRRKTKKKFSWRRFSTNAAIWIAVSALVVAAVWLLVVLPAQQEENRSHRKRYADAEDRVLVAQRGQGGTIYQNHTLGTKDERGMWHWVTQPKETTDEEWAVVTWVTKMYPAVQYTELVRTKDEKWCMLGSRQSVRIKYDEQREWSIHSVCADKGGVRGTKFDD